MSQLQSSISDTYKYKNACQMAALDDLVFNSFKRNPDYNAILEHVSEDQGRQYKQHIDTYFPEYHGKLKQFKENDAHGSPVVFEYKGIGRFSPTTLRYIKVLSDLRHLFGSLDNFNIIEIGVGYGGQCKVISDFFNINKYYLVDLEEALNLADKYLKKLNVKNVEIVKPLDVTSLDKQFDLIISNYAFTELSKSTQELYLNKILHRSSHGYITSNFVSKEFNIDSFSLDLLKNKLNAFDLRTLEEIPLTHKDNIILFW